MKNNNDQNEPQEYEAKIPAFIRKLMPSAPETEIEQATENVQEYLRVALRIHERLQSEQEERNIKDELLSPLLSRIIAEQQNVLPFLRRLMPKGTEEELAEVTERLVAYLEVVFRIHERIEGWKGRESQAVE